MVTWKFFFCYIYTDTEKKKLFSTFEEPLAHAKKTKSECISLAKSLVTHFIFERDTSKCEVAYYIHTIYRTIGLY